MSPWSPVVIQVLALVGQLAALGLALWVWRRTFKLRADIRRSLEEIKRIEAAIDAALSPWRTWPPVEEQPDDPSRLH